MANTATAIMRLSRRYLCMGCPEGDAIHRNYPDDDRCPKCRGEVYAFDAVECPTCLDWAAVEDADIFRERHACFGEGV